jgi:hypothetical protein
MNENMGFEITRLNRKKIMTIFKKGSILHKEALKELNNKKSKRLNPGEKKVFP